MRTQYAPIFIFILLLAIIFVFTENNDLEGNVALEKAKAEQFKKLAKEKDLEILILNQEKDSLNLVIGNLNSKISKAKKEIETIKKKRNEKINVVNSYSVDELQKFFSENYPTD